MGAVLRQGPAVDRHAQHLRASVPEFGDQLLVGNAVLQDRHSQALDGGLCVERGAVSADAAQFLKQCHAALREHTGGNPRPFLELWSRAPDVSLMGGVGGHQVGIEAVSALLTAAAKTLNYETWDAATLASSFGDELGFTVELEHLTRKIDGKTDEMSLRATSVYRREDGAWKVIHRHGDGLMTVEIDPEGRR